MAIDFNLYLITDRKQIKQPLSDAARLALKGGVRAIQLREKDLPVRELLALAREMRALTREFGARLFINDRLDVAMIVDADGVHLGHDSMPVDAARKVAGSRLMIGASTHNLEEARAAEQGGADFITYGPVYETSSKVNFGAPVGVESLRAAVSGVSIPIFGLGGIKSGNAGQVIGTGVAGIALISEIFSAQDIERKAQEVSDLVNSVSGK